MSSQDARLLAGQILETIPVIMRAIASEFRQSEHDLAAPHFRLLWMLSRRSCTLSELAEKQLVSLPTMSNSVSILEERGWVIRTRSDDDRRKVTIELSQAGRLVLSEVQQQAEVRLAEHLSSLSLEERDKLLEGLAILRDVFLPVQMCSAEEVTT